jgi:hypothetical protein
MRLADSIDDLLILRRLIGMADVTVAFLYPLSTGAVYNTVHPASIA